MLSKDELKKGLEEIQFLSLMYEKYPYGSNEITNTYITLNGLLKDNETDPKKVTALCFDIIQELNIDSVRFVQLIKALHKIGAIK